MGIPHILGFVTLEFERTVGINLKFFLISRTFEESCYSFESCGNRVQLV